MAIVNDRWLKYSNSQKKNPESIEPNRISVSFESEKNLQFGRIDE